MPKPASTKKPAPLRVTCIADTHLVTPHTQSVLFPHHLARLKLPELQALGHRIGEEIDRAYRTCLQELRDEPPEAIVHLGDVIYGWDREGVGLNSALKLATQSIRELDSIGPDVYCTIGNHDLGNRGTLDDKDVLKALHTFEEALTSLWWTHHTASVLFLGICGAIAGYKGTNKALIKKRETQDAFIRDALASNPTKPWVLCIHNPLEARFVADLVSDHLDRFQGMLCGHIHNPHGAIILRQFSHLPRALPNRRARAFAKMLRKVTICPSAAPLWWRGYGLEKIGMKKRMFQPTMIDIKKPQESQDIPCASMRWCVRRIAVR